MLRLNYWRLFFPFNLLVASLRLQRHQTFNAIFDVLSWSLKHLALGIHPVKRHDGKDFGTGEVHRSMIKIMPARALLVEIRADWAALKQTFQFPQQNENAGICWMCFATPANVRDCGTTASWRTERQSSMSFHKKLRQTGKSCSLWSVPGVSSAIVIVDWLHCADLGVSADVLGNILVELVELLPGPSRPIRMQALWSEIRLEYDRQGVKVPYRFPHMRYKSFKTAKKSPKLKGKAAHIRSLVPILDRIVQDKMVSLDVHTQTVKFCMQQLAECYKHALAQFSASLLDESARKMALLYVALEKEADDCKVWKIKPKLHLFLELCSFLCLQRQQSPRFFWTYADETNGGTMRHMGCKRGGKNVSSASAQRLLTMWVCQQDFFNFGEMV